MITPIWLLLRDVKNAPKGQQHRPAKHLAITLERKIRTNVQRTLWSLHSCEQETTGPLIEDRERLKA